MIKTALDVHHLLDQYSIERNTYQNMGIFVCYIKLIQILVYNIYTCTGNREGAGSIPHSGG